MSPIVVFVTLGLGFGIAFLDWTLGRLAPRLMAKLAIVPVGVEHRVALPRHARPSAEVGYRHTAGAVADFGIGSRWQALEVVPYYAPLDDVPPTWAQRTPALLVVEGRVEDGVLALRTQMSVPALVPGLAMFTSFLVVADGAGLIPAWLPGIPGAAFLGFIVWAATRQAVKERRATARRLVKAVGDRYSAAAS